MFRFVAVLCAFSGRALCASDYVAERISAEGLNAIAVGHTDDVACRLHGYVEYHFSIPPIDQISLLEFPRICQFRKDECLSFASDVYSSTELVAATKASRPALPLVHSF